MVFVQPRLLSANHYAAKIMSLRKQSFSFFVALLLLAAPIPSLSQLNQEKAQLAHPSGKYGVARIAYDWVDTSRSDTFSNDTHAHRELMVYVWYPRRVLEESTKSEYLRVDRPNPVSGGVSVQKYEKRP